MTPRGTKRLRNLMIILLGLILLFFAIELIVRHDPIRQSFADFFWRNGKLDLAQRIWRGSVNPHDGDPIPESGLGKAYYRAGDHAQAESFYEQALKEDRERSGILYDLGNANYRREELDKALDHYKAAMLRDPKDQDAKSNYELVLMRKGYKPPQKEDEEEQQHPEKQDQQEYENILNALDQKETYDRQNQRQADPARGQRWW